jgi:predicted transcriptional regulator
MTTTSLKLSIEAKARATAAAQRMGVTPHAFMVRAIEDAATRAELRASFVADAQAARADALESGEGFVVGDVHASLRERAAGGATGRPNAVRWRG